MLKKFSIILVVMLLCISYGNAQVSGNRGERKASFKVQDCSFEIDSLTLVPYTIDIRSSDGTQILEYSVQNSSIILDSFECAKYKGDSLTIKYRTLPLNIEEEYYHLDSTMMKEEDRAIYIGSDYSFEPKGQQIIDAKGLDYNGSFSRGFSVGNSQSLVLNSNFNLQLAGDLGNDLKVVAAISDDNIPIQPEGNTQLIQEFDKVFIKVSKDKTNVIVGDYSLQRPESYFINYSKKLKGLSGNNLTEFDNNKSLSSKASIAASRGKFARQTLATKEGNQGPYKLTGNNGERFLIVLSGTEKVYLDGQLLERGLDYDYIIDYNRAEVTFTPLRLIGRESRIIIEYEYRDQNYSRYLYAADVNYKTQKYDLNFNFYNEQDSKTATGDIVLDSMDIAQLSAVGDRIDEARILSIQPADDSTFLSGQVKYWLNPNVMEGDTAPFFLEYSVDITKNLYVASFREVNQGEGAYEIDDSSLINGRVYKYVGPKNGSYEPYTSLTPPEKKQVMSFGANLRPSKNINIGSEFSLSNTDINRFATIDNDDNIGLAGVLTYNHNISLGKNNKIKLITNNKLEFLDENYVTLNPYRNAEFSRDWNISTPTILGRQNLIESDLALQLSDSLTARYSINYFDVQSGESSTDYQGINQKGEVNYIRETFNINGRFDILTSEGYNEKTVFKRPSLNVSQRISKKYDLRLTGNYFGEVNERSNLDGGNTLLSNSFSFDVFKAIFSNGEQNKLHYKLQYSTRKDRFPDADQLIESISTNEINTSAKWAISPNHGLSFNFGFRDFQVIDGSPFPEGSQSKKTLIGKLDHNLSAFDGLFVSNTSYLINSGQEPKVEYFFEKVEKGQGDYIYIGDPDSTLINANFRYAPDLGTGEYIRLSLINNEFITTNNQSISQSLRLDPKKFFNSRTKKRRAKERKEKAEKANSTVSTNEKKTSTKVSKTEKFLSRFSTISTYRISKKIEDDGTSQSSTFLNFKRKGVDNLVSYTSLISNTLFVNKGNPTYDFQIGNKLTENAFTQILGLELRNINESFFRSRVKIGRAADFILNLKKGNRGYNAPEVFEDRNLDIDYYSVSPEISIRPSTNIRFNLLYTLDERDQKINGMEAATSHDFTLNTTYRKASDTNLNFSLSFVNVTTNVEPNSPIEFDLLDGLKSGKNYIWNTLFTKRLSNNVDLNISYEGRKSESASTVHIARAQVKATF